MPTGGKGGPHFCQLLPLKILESTRTKSSNEVNEVIANEVNEVIANNRVLFCFLMILGNYTSLWYFLSRASFSKSATSALSINCIRAAMCFIIPELTVCFSKY